MVLVESGLEQESMSLSRDQVVRGHISASRQVDAPVDESTSTTEAQCHGMLVGIPAGGERSCLCQETSGGAHRQESASTIEALGHVGPRKGCLCDQLVGQVGHETGF